MTKLGLIIGDDEIEVVNDHGEFTTSHFFPGYDDQKMARAINVLNENQTQFSKRGRPKENAGPAGRKFYNDMCLRCTGIYIKNGDDISELTAKTESWKKRVPGFEKVAAAGAFVSRRGEISTGN